MQFRNSAETGQQFACDSLRNGWDAHQLPNIYSLKFRVPLALGEHGSAQARWQGRARLCQLADQIADEVCGLAGVLKAVFRVKRLELILNGEGHSQNSSGRHMQLKIAVVLFVITIYYK